MELNKKKGVDFPESYCPVGLSSTFKIVLALTAAIRNILGIYDVKNAFQTSIAPEDFRIWVTAPKIYMEWYLTTDENFEYDDKEEYVRLCYNGNQGTKAAPKIWYDTLERILNGFGYTNCILTSKERQNI